MKQVLYDAESILDLALYGIEIPSLFSRKTDTLKALLAIPGLRKSQSEWLIEGITTTVSREDLERVHSRAYVRDLYSGALRERLFEAYELLDPDGNYNRYTPDKARKPITHLFSTVLKVVAGTCQTCLNALDTGFCYFFGGGMHHGHHDYGHGFCPVNDIAIAAARMLAEKRARRIWIIDADVHKGDGTAEIFSCDERVRTLSIHMAHGWPLDQREQRPDGSRNPAFIPSDIDIPIDIAEEDKYVPRLITGLEQLEALDTGKADLAIVLHGVDPYEHDELESSGLIRLTKEQLFKRDRAICEFLESRSIPSAWTMAGGYGRRSWEIHARFLQWALSGITPESDPR